MSLEDRSGVNVMDREGKGEAFGAGGEEDKSGDDKGEDKDVKHAFLALTLFKKLIRDH